MLVRSVLVLVLVSLASRAEAQSSALAVPTGYAEEVEGTGDVEDAVGTEASAHNLDLWLEHYAAQANSARITSGVLTLTIGAGVLGIEGWLFSEVAPHASSDPGLLLLVGAGTAIAILDVALGILALARPSLAEQRLERWRAMRAAGPVSARALGRFEGELRGELAQVQDARWASLALGIGVSCASVLGFGLTAGLADTGDGQLMGYLISGALGVIGIVFSVFPWLFDQPEREWQQIEEGTAPGLAITSVAPWASQYGGGFALNGTF
jgi:hypothetical protein